MTVEEIVKELMNKTPAELIMIKGIMAERFVKAGISMDDILIFDTATMIIEHKKGLK